MAGLSVGVYFDGFNVYYGGKKQFGPGAAGWKWFSPRNLATNTLQAFLSGPHATPDIQSIWGGCSIDRVVFCTAKISQDRDHQAYYDQLAFINAIDGGNHIDLLELGHYVARVKQSPLATIGASGSPEVVTSQWPLMIQDQLGNPVPSARFMVSHFHSEEKGSDVNLATHLLKDTFEGRIDGAIVFSNDSDLSLPVEVARGKIPIGVVNPFPTRPHYSLTKGNDPSKGDWFSFLNQTLFSRSQMPTTVGTASKPALW